VRVQNLRVIFASSSSSSSSSAPILNSSLAYTRADTKVVWKIKNFSSVRKKSYLQSDKFSFADFNWCVPLSSRWYHVTCSFPQ
jgi:hypothetical protein